MKHQHMRGPAYEADVAREHLSRVPGVQQYSLFADMVTSAITDLGLNTYQFARVLRATGVRDAAEQEFKRPRVEQWIYVDTLDRAVEVLTLAHGIREELAAPAEGHTGRGGRIAKQREPLASEIADRLIAAYHRAHGAGLEKSRSDISGRAVG